MDQGGLGGRCISCLEINCFHFLSVGAEGREWDGYQTGRIPHFLSTESQQVRQWHLVTKKVTVFWDLELCEAPRDNPLCKFVS